MTKPDGEKIGNKGSVGVYFGRSRHEAGSFREKFPVLFRACPAAMQETSLFKTQIPGGDLTERIDERIRNWGRESKGIWGKNSKYKPS